MPAEQNILEWCDRGVAILSIDTEQIWGYFDRLGEARFHSQYPGALDAHEKLLEQLCQAQLKATWFVVGGMSLSSGDGPQDDRMTGLPADWIAKIPRGGETSTPLWYRQSFVRRLRDAHPRQEIGLHGGLTHLIWTDAHATREVVRWELAQGVKALHESSVQPVSFSFGREQEAYHELLPAHGIRCYRGRTPVLASRLGRTIPGKLLRVIDELTRSAPPPIWPHETLPGLWNIPSSLFLYPIGPTRTMVLPLRSRVERFSRGLEKAARYRGIFHFCLHPENLAESPDGFNMFEDLLDRLDRARESGDIEVLTVGEVVSRMEGAREKPLAVPIQADRV